MVETSPCEHKNITMNFLPARKFCKNSGAWSRASSGGFTLIELMIAVGIIGILVSLTAPMYARYQARARQAEAKLGLSSIYAMEKSFFTEYGAYIAGMDAIGYFPEGNRRFYAIGWVSASNAGDVKSFGGNPGVAYYDKLNVPAQFSAACLYSNWGVGSTSPAAGNADPQSFQACASGFIRLGSQNCDVWFIDEQKTLTIFKSGI